MSGFFTFVLIVQTLVAVALITLILMQRSEGGGLAGGGSPAGMMSARGASDFLTRGTSILATVFICLSILLAGLAAGQRGTSDVQGVAAKAPAAPRPAGSGAAPAPKAATPAPSAPAGNSSRGIPGQ
jgi:preprotein translocase subunit SecG